MNGLLMFLLSSWISCAVSKVEIKFFGKAFTATYDQALNLDCTVAAPDTFLGWKSPTEFVHNSSDYTYETNGDNHKLKIHEVLMRDAGVWACLSNQGNNDTFIMNIFGKLMAKPDENQNIVKGLPGIISLNIAGYPKPTTTWKKDGAVISIIGRFSLANNGSLLISVVEAGDEGLYQVESQQGPVSITVPDIAVTVLESPTFTSVSVNENKTLGGDVTIACAATGTPLPTISWKKDSVDLIPGGRISISSTDLTIQNIQMDDIGSYTCVAENSAGVKKQTSHISSILVTIVGTPVKTQNIVKGKLGVVMVNVVGYPKPDFKWKKNDVDVLEGPRLQVAGNGSLVISYVELSDAGTYELLATQNKVQETIKGIVVNVLAPPTFTSVSVQESRTVGGNILFKCNATGSPLPTITWKKGTEDITADARHQINAEGLTITNITTSDVGDYSCVANSSVGINTQISKLVSVLIPPQIAPLEDKQAKKGKSLKVTCSTTGGRPQADVEWRKNGNDVPDKQQKKYSGGNVLTIDNIQPEDSGKYECFAKNGAVDENGQEIVRNQSMAVSVVYPPVFDPTSTQALAEFNKEIEIKCIVNGNPAPNVSLSFKKENIQGELTKSLTQTVFTVNVNITKVDDYGVYTCTASNTLKSGVTHEVVVTIPLEKAEIVNVKPGCNNVTFSWQQDMTGPIDVTEFLLTLHQNSASPALQKQIVPVDKSTLQFDRLQENTKYEIRLKQETGIAGTGYTTTEKFTTGKCALQTLVFDDFSFDDGDTRVTWAEADGDVAHYIFKYRLKDGDEWKSQITYVITVELPDLEEGEIYQFQVFVKFTQGDVKNLTSVVEMQIAKDDDEDHKSTNPPKPVTRKKGLSGGAIAAIVIVIILLVLIAVDIFCCFFNQCGVVHMCAAACSGRGKSKYNVDGSNPEEGTKLKEVEGEQEPVV